MDGWIEKNNFKIHCRTQIWCEQIWVAFSPEFTNDFWDSVRPEGKPELPLYIFFHNDGDGTESNTLDRHHDDGCDGLFLFVSRAFLSSVQMALRGAQRDGWYGM